MFTQTFDNMMLPSKTHVLGTPESQPGASHRSALKMQPGNWTRNTTWTVEVEIRTSNEKNDEDQSEATTWIISDFSEEETMARRSA